MVYVPSVASSSRGTGDIIKEALIYSTVNAGVNAAANRIFYPSHFSGHSSGYSSGYGSGYGSGSGADHTSITHNNYYYNQPPSVPQGVDNVNSFSGTPTNVGSSAAPSLNSRGVSNQPSANNQPSPNNQPSANNQPLGTNQPALGINNEQVSSNNESHNYNPDVNNLNNNNNQPSNPYVPPSYQPQMRISDEELSSLTEDLFSRQEHEINKYIKINLQKMVNGSNVTDESNEP